MKTFSYENDKTQGVAVTATHYRLHPMCWTESEVDQNILQLKRDLDRVGVNMKRALQGSCNER